MALGALIIKERLGVSDRETVEQIRENPYLQYFLGISVYSNQQLFDASMLMHFRQRISGKMVNRISKEEKKQAQNDERVRNCIEGKFGEGKRRYSLNLVMAKLPNSSETVIAITFLTMNLFALLRQILLLFLQKEYRSYFSLLDISKNYIRCQLVTQTYSTPCKAC